MFEFNEIEEIEEIRDSNTSNTGYTYTSTEVWQMGKSAIEKLFEANKDLIFPED